jgi:hypothetical protein
MSRVVRVSILLGCLLSFSSANRAQHVDYHVCESAHSGIGATQPLVLILRPRVKYWKETFSSRTKSEGASEAVQMGFHGVLSRTFEDQGYTSLFDTTLIEQWEETPPNDAAIRELQDDYDSLTSQTFGEYSNLPPDCGRFLKTPLPDDLEKVTGSSGFDVVVLARAYGKEVTKGGKIDFYSPFPPTFSLDFSIGVLNGRTGLPVYHCSSEASGKNLVSFDSQLSGPVRKCLKRYFSRSRKHP